MAPSPLARSPEVDAGQSSRKIKRGRGWRFQTADKGKTRPWEGPAGQNLFSREGLPGHPEGGRERAALGEKFGLGICLAVWPPPFAFCLLRILIVK